MPEKGRYATICSRTADHLCWRKCARLSSVFGCLSDTQRVEDAMTTILIQQRTGCQASVIKSYVASMRRQQTLSRKPCTESNTHHSHLSTVLTAKGCSCCTFHTNPNLPAGLGNPSYQTGQPQRLHSAGAESSSLSWSASQPIGSVKKARELKGSLASNEAASKRLPPAQGLASIKVEIQ